MNTLLPADIEKLGYKQLGNLPAWSNGKYQLRLYLDSWKVYKKQDNNVLYEFTDIYITSVQALELLQDFLKPNY